MGLEWHYKLLSWKIIKYLDVHMGIMLHRKKYCGKKIASVVDVNNLIEEKIRSGEPFAAARIGGSELRSMVTCQKYFKNMKKKEENRSLLICLSGFFGDMDDYDKFSRVSEKALGSIDIIGIWYNQMEDYMIKHYCPKNVYIGKLEGLEPWYTRDNPWTKALKGKKVVCVHPFKDSILSQYEKRELLFPGTDILPEFELRCVKAVQTLFNQKDDRFDTWFDALDYMFDEVMKEDFDVALVSCGAYGLPLAAKIKDAGKQAVHMGGALQLLFGVKGARWDDFEPLNDLYSDAWQYPLESERLEKDSTEGVEGGCYWKAKE